MKETIILYFYSSSNIFHFVVGIFFFRGLIVGSFECAAQFKDIKLCSLEAAHKPNMETRDAKKYEFLFFGSLWMYRRILVFSKINQIEMIQKTEKCFSSAVWLNKFHCLSLNWIIMNQHISHRIENEWNAAPVAASSSSSLLSLAKWIGNWKEWAARLSVSVEKEVINSPAGVSFIEFWMLKIE